MISMIWNLRKELQKVLKNNLIFIQLFEMFSKVSNFKE